jgi:hypothetical protein
MMRKFVVGMVAILAIALIVSACKDQREIKGYVDREKVVHDTVYVDSFVVEKHDTMFYDSKWLRNAFETTEWKTWTNYKDSFSVDYPACMSRIPNNEERNLRVEYHGITMTVTTYDDAEEKSVREKYDAVSMGAVTKSIADSSFLMAGRAAGDKLYFEKDIKVRSKTWMYIRVEFHRELTWSVDPLLQYVLQYDLVLKQ